ncbi:MAG: DUF697 domain-containing protein [Gracilibacteraceae bacterium]|jgi:uncharacterized protein (DUF697 family)|nr:DUF697 domain-containing protein [Gracilibacteraceae bacterium]
MANENYIKGAEATGQVAEKVLNMVGAEVKGASEVLLIRNTETQGAINEALMDYIDTDDKRLKLQEYGFKPLDFNQILNISPENRTVIATALLRIYDESARELYNEYIQSIIARLGVLPQAEVDLNLISNLVPEETAILAKFLFDVVAISGNDSIIKEKVDHLLEHAEISNKRLREINDQVQSVYDKLPDKYGLLVIGGIQTPSLFELEEKINESNDLDAQYAESRDIYAATSGKYAFTDCKIEISKMLSITDADIIFNNCVITFNSEFPVAATVKDSKLHFNKCVFVTERVCREACLAAESTSIDLNDCTFAECTSVLDSRHSDERCVIKSSDETINVSNCKFKNCIGIIFKADLSLKNCQIVAHKGKFSISANKMEINGSKISECLSAGRSWNEYLFCFKNYGELSLFNTFFRDIDIEISQLYKLEIVQCHFENILSGYIGKNREREHYSFLRASIAEITGTTFIKTIGLCGIGGFVEPSNFTVKNSKFESCSGCAIHAEQMNVTNCIFTDCVNNETVDLYDPKVSTMMESWVCGNRQTDNLITVVIKSKNTGKSTVVSCKFNNCTTNGSIIGCIAGKEANKEQEFVAVRNCEFDECIPLRGYTTGIRETPKNFTKNVNLIVELSNTGDTYFNHVKDYAQSVEMQDFEYKEMLKKADNVVLGFVAATGATGAIPIPFADAPLLIGEEVAMMIAINSVFQFNVSRDTLKSLATAAVGVGGATVIGRTVVANALKFIPGVGSVVGGAISASTAGLITLALGKAYIQVCKAIKMGKLNQNDLSKKEGAEVLKAEFKEQFQKNKK